MDAVVAAKPEEGRYELRVGGELVGFAMYRDEHGSRVFFHTEVDPHHHHEGLGHLLVTTALGEMREQGTPVIPLCPFFAAFIRENPDWHDVLDPRLRERFQHA